jgi:hypothetical protein
MRQTLTGIVKGCSKAMLYTSPIPHRNRTQKGPHDYLGPAIAQGFKAKPISEVSAALSQGTKQHKGWPAVGTPGTPLRGPEILKLCI